MKRRLKNSTLGACLQLPETRKHYQGWRDSRKTEKGQRGTLDDSQFGQKSLDELMERLEQKGYLDAIQTPPDTASPDGAGDGLGE